MALPTPFFDVGSGFDGSVLSIQRQVLGNVYVGGSFTSYDGFTSSGIVRLSNKGTRDVNFIVGDGFSGPIDSQALGKVISVALTTDGSLDVYAGGPFTAYDGSASNGIARLDVDGSLDAGFTPEISFGDETCSNQTIPD